MDKFYLDSEEDALKFFESGNHVTNQELVDILENIGFSKRDFGTTFILKHNNVEENVRFFKNSLEELSQKNVGTILRIIREAIAKKSGNYNFEEPKNHDDMLQKMGIPPLRRKTTLETIRTDSNILRKTAVAAALERKSNPQKRGRKRSVPQEQRKNPHTTHDQ